MDGVRRLVHIAAEPGAEYQRCLRCGKEIAGPFPAHLPWETGAFVSEITLQLPGWVVQPSTAKGWAVQPNDASEPGEAACSAPEEPFANIRTFLGDAIGRRIVEVTQHDEADWLERREAFFDLMFEDGSHLRVWTGDDTKFRLFKAGEETFSPFEEPTE